MVRGLHDIAMLRLERDIADINYQVALEFINSTKLTTAVVGEPNRKGMGASET